MGNVKILQRDHDEYTKEEDKKQAIQIHRKWPTLNWE